MKTNFFASYVSPNAEKYVGEVLRSTMLSEGTVTRQFEISLEKHFNLPDDTVLCTNSGTSALHLALKTLGIRLYDEVIIPPLTFIATGLAVLYCNATPIFADILPDGTIDPEDIERKITPDTKAIIAVNWVGKACKLDEIQRIAKKHGVKLVVDAAQSLGVGMGGDITCLSFQATKHLTTGDGGAVICYNPKDYEKARRLRWFGIDRNKDLPDVLGEKVYNLDWPFGFKYHMNNVAAAIGMANLETFDERQFHRTYIASIYRTNLSEHLPLTWTGESAYWHYPIYVDEILKFSKRCQINDVPVNIIHRGIDQNRIFGDVPFLPNMRVWEEHVTHLPIHHEITEELALEFCRKVNQYA